MVILLTIQTVKALPAERHEAIREFVDLLDECSGLLSGESIPIIAALNIDWQERIYEAIDRSAARWPSCHSLSLMNSL